MTGAGDWLANKLLDKAFGGTDFTPAAILYVALHTADPTTAGPSDSNEVTGTNYARVAVTNNTTNFPNASARSKSNGTVITFPTPGAGGWGEVTHVSLSDQPDDTGNMYGVAELAIPNTINQNNPVTFPVGDLDFSIPEAP